MLAEFGGFLEKIIASTWNMLNSSSPWIIFSFLVAGLLHEFLKPEKIQKTAIGSGKISGVFWTTISGMFIPICSDWNNSTWNQYVLQRGLSWTNAGIHDQHADD